MENLDWTPVPEFKGRQIGYDEESDMVLVPRSYWIELVEYIADTETNKQILVKK